VVEKIAPVRHEVQQRLDARQKVIAAGEVRARAAPAVRATPVRLGDAAMQAVGLAGNGDAVHVVRHQPPLLRFVPWFFVRDSLAPFNSQVLCPRNSPFVLRYPE